MACLEADLNMPFMIWCGRVQLPWGSLGSIQTINA